MSDLIECAEHMEGMAKIHEKNGDKYVAMGAQTAAAALRASAEREARLREALGRCLNFIENTESEMGETLSCGDAARAALAAANGP